jgi:tetratricopeptide (TPR) repeat protein
LGNLFYEEEDYAKSLKCYVTAMDVKKRYLGAMIGAGQSLRMLGDHEKALRMGRQVLRVEENDPDALFLVGATFFQRGEHAGAFGPLNRFLETNPEIEIAIEVRGMLQICRQELGMPEE